MQFRGRGQRRGAHLIECAIIFPIVFLLLLGLVICAMGVFRYQEVAYLSREAARYASVHAGMYQLENAGAITAGTLPNVTSDYITTNIVKANAANMDFSQLSVTINFNTSSGSFGWDDTANNGQRYPYSPKTVNGTNYNDTNTVSVTITYQWYPEWGLGGPITLTSTAVMPVSY
jgi:Flp pilus assembly protein TadG